MGFAVKWHLASFPGLKKRERERGLVSAVLYMHVLAMKFFTLLIYFMTPKLFWE